MLTVFKYLIVPLVATVFGIVSGTAFLNMYGRAAQCIRSFNAFAYEGPPPRDSIYPSPPIIPWQVEEIDTNELPGRLYDVELSRSVGENDELWIWYRDTSVNESETQWAVYQPQTQTWELISREIENTPLQVDKLFLTSSGELWGRNRLDTNLAPSEIEFIPALSRFNENTRRFEVAEGVPETPTDSTLFSNSGMPIILDHDNNFWILVQGDAIYRYDPDTQTTQRMVELERQNTKITDTALAPDGSIYFEYYYWNGDGRLEDNSVYQFLPETNEVQRVDLPDEDNWPIYGGLRFSSSGRLWLGATGYRETDGSWYLINPNPPRTFDQLQTSPALFFESSNGVLWFNRWVDTGGLIDGAAWFNPATGEGCQFTNQLVFSMVEDSQHQLWLVSEGIYIGIRSKHEPVVRPFSSHFTHSPLILIFINTFTTKHIEDSHMPEKTSQITPKASRPTMQNYGIASGEKGLMDWKWADDQLGKSRNYWISTASAEGLPHAAPVWGVWLDGALYFSSDPNARKIRNFRHNPNNVVVHLESGDDVVILTGTVTEMHDAPLFAQVAKIYAEKYGFNPAGDTQPPDGSGFWIFRPTSGLTWLEKDFPNTATRWTF